MSQAVAATPAVALLDTQRALTTPEGVALNIRPAGLPVRILAHLIDQLIRSAVLVGAMPLFILLGQSGVGFALLLFFALEWGYPVLFEVRRGATPGKRVFGLRVVHRDGTPIGWRASILRNLLRAVDAFPSVCYLPGGLCVLYHPEHARIGDIAAGTRVVHDDRAPRPLPRAAAEVLVPPIPLTLAERRALLEFAERRREWSQPRAQELASVLAPLVGTEGPQALQRVLGMAAWAAQR